MGKHIEVRVTTPFNTKTELTTIDGDKIGKDEYVDVNKKLIVSEQRLRELNGYVSLIKIERLP